MPKHVLVTGANGQLGQSIAKLADTYPHLVFTFITRAELDLRDSVAVESYFQGKSFDVIINSAAYTSVDKAESEPELADQINHLAVKQLAQIAKRNNIALIHISTDYVFNGQNFKPYVETDAVDPQNVYGLTKLKGEQAFQAVNPRGLIIRTSWVYSEFGSNFVKTMMRLGQEKESLNVIFDQVGSPTYACDLAQAILTIIDSQSEVQGEELLLRLSQLDSCIYHYSNEGVCSWYDFAKAIFELTDIGCQLNPIETKAYPTPAKRPYYSLMNKLKIKQNYDLVIPYWKDSLNNSLQILQGNK